MNKILFLIGSANISGGTYVIFQHALHLQNSGINVTIACISFNEYLVLKKAKNHWHPALKELHFISIEDISHHHYDLAIFTWWRTVYYLPNINASFHIYFVQSIESKFYDPLDWSLYYLVNSTYTFNFPVITEATWIKEYLYQRYGTKAQLAHNGIRKDIYTPKVSHANLEKKNKFRVLIEGPLGVPFKNIEKTIKLCSSVNDIEIWLLTSSKINRYEKVDKIFSCLPIQETAEVYRSCDVLVKLSYVEGMFGPPLEMFHCGGTCIVYDVTGHDEYIQDGYNGIVVKTNDEDGVVNSLKRLINDRDYLNKLKAGALETAKRWINWKQSSEIFSDALKKIIADPITASHIEYLCRKVDHCFKQHEMAVKNQTKPYQMKYKFKNLVKLFLNKYPRFNIAKQLYYSLRKN